MTPGVGCTTGPSRWVGPTHTSGMYMSLCPRNLYQTRPPTSDQTEGSGDDIDVFDTSTGEPPDTRRYAVRTPNFPSSSSYSSIRDKDLVTHLLPADTSHFLRGSVGPGQDEGTERRVLRDRCAQRNSEEILRQGSDGGRLVRPGKGRSAGREGPRGGATGTRTPRGDGTQENGLGEWSTDMWYTGTGRGVPLTSEGLLSLGYIGRTIRTPWGGSWFLRGVRSSVSGPLFSPLPSGLTPDSRQWWDPGSRTRPGVA